MQPLSTISPLDGRYHEQLEGLEKYVSEMALMRYRLVVEIEYFISLSEEVGIIEFPELSKEQKELAREIYRNFSLEDANAVKAIEQTTKHDVKAIEYFLKKRLTALGLEAHVEFVHFALTSEDINNISYSLMWYDAVSELYRPLLQHVYTAIKDFALANKDVPMLALTHGQSATPTTVGKEYAVFAGRLRRQMDQLFAQKYLGKFSGATGTWGAHTIAYPQVDWIAFSKNFLERLGLAHNPLTTQIEPHDSLCESYHMLCRINAILMDLCRDTWLYISRGIFLQKKKEGEVGSSTMPHKINPIHFENAEGNLGLSTAIFTHLAEKLPISRMQRDLSDSTVLRNQGVPLAHAVLACHNILEGMSRIALNEQKLNEELDGHYEILAEAVQTVLRKHNIAGAYEKMKELTRGQEITKEALHAFIATLDIPKDEKERLVALTPQTYIGLSSTLSSLA